MGFSLLLSWVSSLLCSFIISSPKRRDCSYPPPCIFLEPANKPPIWNIFKATQGHHGICQTAFSTFELQLFHLSATAKAGLALCDFRNVVVKLQFALHERWEGFMCSRCMSRLRSHNLTVHTIHYLFAPPVLRLSSKKKKLLCFHNVNVVETRCLDHMCYPVYRNVSLGFVSCERRRSKH